MCVVTDRPRSDATLSASSDLYSQLRGCSFKCIVKKTERGLEENQNRAADHDQVLNSLVVQRRRLLLLGCCRRD